MVLLLKSWYLYTVMQNEHEAKARDGLQTAKTPKEDAKREPTAEAKMDQQQQQPQEGFSSFRRANPTFGAKP